MAGKTTVGKAGALILVLPREPSRVVGEWELGMGLGGWSPVVGALESHHGPFRGAYRNI